MLWHGLAAGGGTLAVVGIVALALAIHVLIVLYVGSAAAVLERFARVRPHPAAVALFAALAVAVTAFVSVALDEPALRLGGAGWRAAFTSRLPATAGVALVALAGTRLALSRLGGPGLVIAVVLWLGSAAVLALASLAQPLFVAAPAAAVAGVALWLRARRRAAGDGSAGALERGALVLAVLALAGAGAAAALPAPSAPLFAVGRRLAGAFSTALGLGLLPLAAAGVVRLHGGLEWFIAVRYLLARRRQVFISAITGICVMGVAAGVWLLIVVLSVMNGFERTWRDEILGNRAHLTVHHGDGPIADYRDVLARVREEPAVLGASPYLDADGLARGEGGETFTVRVRGVEPASVSRVTDLASDLVLGRLADLGAEHGEAAPPPVLIGSQLANALGISLGDRLRLISPFGGRLTPLGPQPRLTGFRVAGVFRSTFFQYEEVYVYVPLADAQAFRRAGDVVDGIEVRTTDYYRSLATGEALRARLGPDFTTRDWKEFFPEFFQALKTERIMMFLLLAMIMVVAAFVIVATLIMMILEKTGDIAILKAMGAEDGSIERIFALEGTLIGVVGTALGVVAGLAVTRRIDWIQARIESMTGVDTLPASVYQLSSLPTEVDPVQIVGVAGIAMVLSLGATLLPSRQGARLDPAQGLRDE